MPTRLLKFSTTAKVGRPLKINSDLPTVAGDSIASCRLHLHVDEQINSNAQIFYKKNIVVLCRPEWFFVHYKTTPEIIIRENPTNTSPKEDLSVDTTFAHCQFSWDTLFNMINKMLTLTWRAYTCDSKNHGILFKKERPFRHTPEF